MPGTLNDRCSRSRKRWRRSSEVRPGAVSDWIAASPSLSMKTAGSLADMKSSDLPGTISETRIRQANTTTDRPAPIPVRLGSRFDIEIKDHSWRGFTGYAALVANLILSILAGGIAHCNVKVDRPFFQCFDDIAVAVAGIHCVDRRPPQPHVGRGEEGQWIESEIDDISKQVPRIGWT